MYNGNCVGVKHDQVPLIQWNDIIQFARETMPYKPPPSFCIDVPLLRAEVHRKKKTAATGLDGASRLDYPQSGDKFLGSVISMFDRACDDGCWPAQILAGSVSSLAKTDDAETVILALPIVVGLACMLGSCLTLPTLGFIQISSVTEKDTRQITCGSRSPMIWSMHMLQVSHLVD